MKNRKGELEGGTKVITIILIILVILVILLTLFRADIVKKFVNLPGFVPDKTDKQTDYSGSAGNDAAADPTKNYCVGAGNIARLNSNSLEFYESGTYVKSKFYVSGDIIYLTKTFWPDKKIATISNGNVALISGVLTSLSPADSEKAQKLVGTKQVGTSICKNLGAAQ